MISSSVDVQFPLIKYRSVISSREALSIGGIVANGMLLCPEACFRHHFFVECSELVNVAILLCNFCIPNQLLETCLYCESAWVREELA